MKQFWKNKKFRYGSLSVAFTAAVIVLIILINTVFTLLASHYHWYVDTTAEQLYTLSDTSKVLLDEIFKKGTDGKTVFDGKLTMTFLQEKDKIEDSQLENAGDSYLKMVHSLALDYAAHYPDHIELKYVDMYAHPGELAEYRKKGLDSMNPDMVIFDNNEGIFRGVSYVNFFYYDSNVSSTVPVSFYGEHKITATILSLCSRQYIAYVTEGHGEDELGQGFTDLLESCGYTLKKVNLRTAEALETMIYEDRPRLIIVNNPKVEFSGMNETAGRKETVVLKKLLDGDYTDSENKAYASLLLFADPDSGCANTNLNAVMNEWGLIVNSTAADMVREDLSETEGKNDATLFRPAYETDPSSFTLSLVKKLAGIDNYLTVMNGAGTIKVTDVSASNQQISNGTILKCSSGAQNDKGSAAGSAVFALSLRENIFGDYAKYNYVIACADTSFVSDEYLGNGAYANETLMVNILRATTNERESNLGTTAIEMKDFSYETNVSGVSFRRKQTFLVFMAVVLPAAILGAGVWVYVRRRNK